MRHRSDVLMGEKEDRGHATGVVKGTALSLTGSGAKDTQ